MWAYISHIRQHWFQTIAFLREASGGLYLPPGKRCLPPLWRVGWAGRNLLGRRGVTLIVAVLLMSCWVQSLIHSSFPFSFKSKHTNISLTTVSDHNVYLADLCKLNSGRKPSFKKKKTLEHCVQDWNQDLVSHMCCFPDSFLKVFFFFSPVEPRMVLVGRGGNDTRRPKSKGIHTHLPDSNCSIHVHFSLTPGRIWSGLPDVTTVPPEELAKGNNWWKCKRGSADIPLKGVTGDSCLSSPFSSGLLGVQAGKESVASGQLRVQGSDTGTGGQDQPQRPRFLASLSGGLGWALNESPFLAEMCSVRSHEALSFSPIASCLGSESAPSVRHTSYSAGRYLILLIAVSHAHLVVDLLGQKVGH